MNSSPSIEVHIDVIVLDGIPFQRTGRFDLGEAVASELTRLLAARSGNLPTGWQSNSPRLTGGPIEVDSADAPHLGRWIARSVFEGVRP